MTTTFQIHAIPAEVLDGVRRAGTDVSGNPVEHLIAAGGEPLRCCLRDAEAGEPAILFGYEPPIPASPYREIGAVFAHAEPCGGPARVDGYPSDWRGRAQVLRAYDRRGWIHDATRLHDGAEPEAAIAAILADPDVVRIHSRNVVWGCFMFEVTSLAPRPTGSWRTERRPLTPPSPDATDRPLGGARTAAPVTPVDPPARGSG